MENPTKVPPLRHTDVGSGDEGPVLKVLTNKIRNIKEKQNKIIEKEAKEKGATRRPPSGTSSKESQSSLTVEGSQASTYEDLQSEINLLESMKQNVAKALPAFRDIVENESIIQETRRWNNGVNDLLNIMEGAMKVISNPTLDPTAAHDCISYARNWLIEHPNLDGKTRKKFSILINTFLSPEVEFRADDTEETLRKMEVHEVPKTGKGKKKALPVNKDRFISKMFLRGDSVIIVLRNSK